MLHIILGILKVIGIIIGIMLLLLLAVILAVVFVPVRYQLKGVKQTEHYEASLRVSWLLHLISVVLLIDSSGQRTVAIHLLGIRLPLFRSKETVQGGSVGQRRSARFQKKKRTGKKMSDQAKKSAQTKRTEQVKKSDEMAKTEQAKKTDQTGNSDEMVKPDQTKKTDQMENSDEMTKTDQTGKSVSDEKTVTVEESIPTGKTISVEEKGIFEKIRFQCKNIYDKIRQIIQRLIDLKNRITGLGQKAAGFRQKAADIGQKAADIGQIAAGIRQRASGILQKPGELLEMAEQYEVKEVVGGLFGYLIMLIRHYKPRRIRGYLRFGTGDPATTGQLTGLIYILLPARADRFTVAPEFNDKVFETEVICSGHIRALHVLRVGWRAFWDKKLRRLIKVLRKKGDS